MTALTLRRGQSPYYRLAALHWNNPIDTSYAQRTGGRWNPEDSFPVLYLNGSLDVAKANVSHLYLKGAPWDAEDLSPGPILLDVTVPEEDYVDAVTPAGLAALGLPKAYPKGVAHNVCQALGLQLWEAFCRGVACCSAAPQAPQDGEELAWFDTGSRKPMVISVRTFEDWYL